MKFSKPSLVFGSIAYAVLAMQVSSMPAPADSAASGATNSSAPTSQPAAQTAAVSVKIDNFAFKPKELEIAVGTTVTWQNADDVPHTATSKDDPQTFDSGALDTDDRFSFTFSKPGKYPYYCKVHPHMTGVVTVK
jgi:plastocyanin